MCDRLGHAPMNVKQLGRICIRCNLPLDEEADNNLESEIVK